MESTIALKSRETAVVGYGSLLSVQSISKTVGHEYTGPFITCYVEGWRRGWNAAMPNRAFYYEVGLERVYPESILYLNVCRQEGTKMNCALFVLQAEELEMLRHREWIYDAVEVNADVRGVRIEGGKALMFVARPEYVMGNASSPSHSAIRASYLRVVDRALTEVGADFRADFQRGTDHVRDHLVIDDKLDLTRQNPWASAGYSYSPEPHIRD